MTVTPNITLLTYCARSGSTLIAQSLNEHLEETIVVPELRLIQLLAWRSENAVSSMTQRQLRRLLKRDFQMSNLGLSHETLEDIASISVGEGRLQLLSNILEAYKVEHSLTGNHYVIKNGRSIHEAWELRRMLPELRVLNVVRDPRGANQLYAVNVNCVFIRWRYGRRQRSDGSGTLATTHSAIHQDEQSFW